MYANVVWSLFFADAIDTVFAECAMSNFNFFFELSVFAIVPGEILVRY